MPYFHVSNGLRGCYMPDSVQCVRADSRRELKSILESEAEWLRDGTVGLSKRAIASLAAEAWRRRADSRWTLDLVAPYRHADAIHKSEYPFALAISRATRRDFLDYIAAEAD